MGELEKTTVTGRKVMIRMPGGREQNSCLNPKNVIREILTGGKCREGPADGAAAEDAVGAAATGPGRLAGGRDGRMWAQMEPPWGQAGWRGQGPG